MSAMLTPTVGGIDSDSVLLSQEQVRAVVDLV